MTLTLILLKVRASKIPRGIERRASLDQGCRDSVDIETLSVSSHQISWSWSAGGGQAFSCEVLAV